MSVISGSDSLDPAGAVAALLKVVILENDAASLDEGMVLGGCNIREAMGQIAFVELL